MGSALAIATVLLTASPASAHGSANFGDLYGGLTQPVFHPESLLLLLALALWTADHERGPEPKGLVAFTAGSVVGAVAGLLGAPVPAAEWLVRAGTLTLGLLVATRWLPPVAVILAAGAALGAAQGHVATYLEREEIARPLLYAIGVTLAPLIVSSWFVALSDRFRADWIGIAFRVGGSWLAAITLMTMGLALTRV